MINPFKFFAQFFENAPGQGNADPFARETYYIPNDNLFANQWNLNNTGQSGGTPGVDINVTGVWDDYTGAGVNVAVYDDGVQYTHPDLNDNYNAALHITIGGAIHDPAPATASDNHGTAVAGLIGAENDGSGTVGVAFGSSLTGVAILGMANPDFNEAMNQQSNFDVVNHSWGFTSGFAANSLSASWAGFFAGIDDAVQNGRGGLGTIMVVAAGNDRAGNRSTNDSDFTSGRETIAVSAVGHNGFVSYYSTEGPSLLVSVTSNGPAGSGIWTTDRTGADGYSDGTNEVGNSQTDYTSTFGGTSAAAPQLSGVVALMLEANPLLGWRDVQEILAYSAVHTGSAIGSAPTGNEEYNWAFNGADNWNGGGLHFSNDYGFGLVDAQAAVRLAETWEIQSTSANEVSASGSFTGNIAIPDNNPTGVSFDITVIDNIDVESIELIMQGNHTWVGDLVITITSPDGTVSNLLNQTGGSTDFPADGWTMTSNAFRGELSAGTWTITISDNGLADTGSVTNLTLNVYGNADINNDVYVYTDEFSDYAGGAAGHGTTINDVSGTTDVINAAAVTTGSTINLGAGTATIDGVAITSISGIENAYGGDGNDNITGDGLANSLSGGRGSDTLNGGAGDDMLYGGAGNDTLLSGSGADLVDGGAGIDTVDYSGATNAQRINLVTNVNIGGFAHDDTLIDIENVIGSDTRGDNITGTAGANELYGMGADDFLRGYHGDDSLFGGENNDFLYGGTGADALDGGNGLDWAMYNGANAAVMLDLATGGTGGEAAGDTYVSIERVRGSIYDDVISGDGGSNKILGDLGNDTIYGAGGKDIIRGGAGDDILDGGAGNDSLFGDAGADTFVFMQGYDHDYAATFENDVDTLQLDSTLWGGGLTAQQVVDTYLVEQNNQRFYFDFGNGNILHVLSTSAMTTADFYDDITIV